MSKKNPNDHVGAHVIRRLIGLFAIALVLLWATPSSAAIVRVQEKAIPRGGSGTASVALTSNTTAGNALIVVFWNFYSQTNYGGVPAISDGTNTYAVAISRDNGGGAYSPSLYIFYAMNIAGGAVTVSVNDHIGGDVIGYVIEYSGLATTSILDQAASNQTASSAGFASSSVTTTQADELLIGFHGYNAGGVSYSATTSPFALVVDQNASGSSHDIVQECIASATGSYQSAGTYSGSTVTDNVIATFKGTGGGGGAASAAPCGSLRLLGVGCNQ